MGVSKQKKLEMAERRQKVARLYLQGKPHRVIAEEVGRSVGTVNRDLSILRKKWEESALVNMDRLIREELARLDQTEQEIREDLRESGQDIEKTTKKIKENLGEGSVTEREIRTIVKEQSKDYHLWRFILEVQEKRRKFLGVYDHDPEKEGSRIKEMVSVIEETAKEVDMSQFEDEEIK